MKKPPPVEMLDRSYLLLVMAPFLLIGIYEGEITNAKTAPFRVVLPAKFGETLGAKYIKIFDLTVDVNKEFTLGDGIHPGLSKNVCRTFSERFGGTIDWKFWQEWRGLTEPFRLQFVNVIQLFSRGVKDSHAFHPNGWGFASVRHFDRCNNGAIEGKLNLDISDTYPSSLFQAKLFDASFDGLLSGLRLRFRSQSAAFSGVGGFSGYSYSSFSHDPLSDCGNGENCPKNNADGLYGKSCSIASLVAGCAGIFFVYFGLRTIQYGGNYWRGLFLVVCGMIFGGVGFNFAAYFFYFGS